MNDRSTLAWGAAALLICLLAACGGGGSGDVTPGSGAVSAPVAGPDSYLRFPNQMLQADGKSELDSVDYAQAYYAAIDPDNAKDTLEKWKAANRFGQPAGALGEVTAVAGDRRDLGYGRRITGRQNPDGTIALLAENYRVDTGAGYGYDKLNMDAAVVSDKRWHVGISAIEFSPAPGGKINFAKFYSFDPATGARRLVEDMDGRGAKAMPVMCLSCHGGRADPLTPAGANGKPLFPLVLNSVSQARGDTQARLQMFNLDALDFSTTLGYTRGEMEAAFKTLNKMVLCSYPLAGPATAPEDACRPAAGPSEWQGTADAVLKAAYGGAGMPNASFADVYVPDAWVFPGQTTLYKGVVREACMTCHMLRGTANQSDINFMTYANFQGFSDRIKVHVFDRGDMPLADIVAARFWNGDMAETVAAWLETQLPGVILRDSSKSLLKPGRPVAKPGPDRVVRSGASKLSARDSLFATTYSWSIVSNPGNGATLTNPASANPIFNASVDGKYVLQLVVGNGTQQSEPAPLTIVVKNALTPDPAAIRFANLKPILQAANCSGCHSAGQGPFKAPIGYLDTDRNGDGKVDGIDQQWFYKELRGRINFQDLAASPLLAKPSGKHHAGRLRPGFDAKLEPGDAGRANYDLFLNWILNDAPL